MVYLFAHRGGFDSGGPENTVEAFAHALSLGASLESDVRLSVDGVPMLVHDPHITGAARLPRRVRRLTADRLERMGALTLHRLYRELGTDFQLSLDLKDRDAGPATIEVARAAGAAQRLWLVHDSIPVLQRIRRAAPDVRLMHETRLHDLARNTVLPDTHMDVLARWKVDAQNTHWSRWTPALVGAAHRRGILAFGSIAQERDDMARALTKGLDGLYTDHVARLVEVATDLGLEVTR
ncbi:MAG: glycerophosphodiester phosphodiesterase family protein [Acidimicrobiales bacterium]